MKIINVVVKVLFSLLVIVACDTKDKENDILLPLTAQEIVLPKDSTSYVFSNVNMDSNIVFKWSAAEYTAPIITPIYLIQFDKAGGDFLNPFKVYEFADTLTSFDRDTINLAILKISDSSIAEFELKIRVQSHINNELVQNSKPISLFITPFIDTTLNSD